MTHGKQLIGRYIVIIITVCLKVIEHSFNQRHVQTNCNIPVLTLQGVGWKWFVQEAVYKNSFI